MLDLAFTGDTRRVNGVIVTRGCRTRAAPAARPGWSWTPPGGRRGCRSGSSDAATRARGGGTSRRQALDHPDSSAGTRGAGPLADRGRRPGRARPPAGVMVAEEGDRWTVTLNGLRDVRPPTRPVRLPGLRPRPSARRRSRTRLAGAGTRWTTGSIYRFPANRRRHYERLSEFPDGLVATGDSLCAFDPVLAQGMTVAALEARDLGALLAEHGDGPGLARLFHARAAAHIDTPWSLVTDAAPRSGGGVPAPAARRGPDGPRAGRGLPADRAAGRTGRRTCCGRGSCCASPARPLAGRVSAGSRPAPAARRPARRAAPHG